MQDRKFYDEEDNETLFRYVSSERERIMISLDSEKLERLRNAKKLFERDLKKSVKMGDFLDVLVTAYLSYRDVRGESESDLLQKLAKK